MSKVISNRINSEEPFLGGNKSRSVVAFAVLGAILLLGISCDDVLETNIERREVFLIAPGDSAVLSSDTVSLWWEHLDGARSYQVRMASPSLASPAGFVMDSVTTANFIMLSLAPGDYEWEVRAMNNGYSTDYFYRTFTVDTSGTATESQDISALSIEVLLPGDMAVLDVASVAFWWTPLEGAEEYELLAVSPDFTAPQTILVDSTVTSNKLTVDVLPGNYEWRVRARNEGYRTAYFYRRFTVDTTGISTYPDISTASIDVLLPQNLTNLEVESVTFWWETLEGAEEYEVRAVSPDFAAPETILLDSTLTSNKITMDVLPGDYEWRVRGKNPGYSTPWTTNSFSVISEVPVDSTYEDISLIKVILLAPHDSLKQAEGNFTFWWEEVTGAEEYELQVVSPHFTKIARLVLDETLTTNQRDEPLDSGHYQWRVRAVNPEYKTNWSTYTLFVD